MRHRHRSLLLPTLARVAQCGSPPTKLQRPLFVIVSVGMTLNIATGGIDLSVGSLMAISDALAPMIFMSSFRRSYPVLGDMLAFIVSVGVAGLFDLFNEWFITPF